VGRTCSVNGEKRNVYRLLVEKLEGKRPLGRPRRGWWIPLRWTLWIKYIKPISSQRASVAN
jgi:hypothetical protein